MTLDPALALALHPLQGKRVFLTGAASGIGAASAALLQAAGARLALCDIDEPALRAGASRLGADVLALRADVTRREEVQAAVAQAAEALGGLDIAWANAGVASMGSVAQGDPLAWQRTIEVNLVGAFHTLQAALPHVQRTRGQVAVTASLAAFLNGPLMSAYCASKAGAEALCNALRVEMVPHGVAVSCIHPSWIDTPMVRHGEISQAFRTLRAAMPAPLRRELPVEEAAALIVRGLARRADRIHLPRFVGWLRWLRTPLHTRLGEGAIRRAMPAIERAYAADLAQQLPTLTPSPSSAAGAREGGA